MCDAHTMCTHTHAHARTHCACTYRQDTCLSVHLSACLFVCVFSCLSVCFFQPVCVSICMFICLNLSFCTWENETSSSSRKAAANILNILKGTTFLINLQSSLSKDAYTDLKVDVETATLWFAITLWEHFQVLVLLHKRPGHLLPSKLHLCPCIHTEHTGKHQAQLHCTNNGHEQYAACPCIQQSPSTAALHEQQPVCPCVQHFQFDMIIKQRCSRRTHALSSCL